MRFEDIPSVQDEILRVVANKVPVDILAKSLVTAPPAIADRIFGFIRPDIAEMIRGMMKTYESISSSEIAASRERVAATIDKVLSA